MLRGMKLGLRGFVFLQVDFSFFSFSAAEQWLNKWFKELRLLHSKGTLYSGLKEKKMKLWAQ